MDNDNLYPNNGEFFTLKEPADQVNDRKKERTSSSAGKKHIMAAIKHLDKRIEFYSSIDSVPEDVLTNPDEFMHCVAANKLTKANLETERRLLADLIE